MKIFSYLHENIKIENATFILGGFESIHHGHKQLINVAKSFDDGPVVICLFKDPSLLPKSQDGNMLQLNTRLTFLADLEVEYVILLDFNDWLQNLEPQKFIDILIKIGAQRFIIGKDYRFGVYGKWGYQELQQYYSATNVVDLVKEKNTKIATSLIKENIIFGDLEYVNSQLVSPYRIDFDFLGQDKPLTWPKNVTPLAKGIYAVNFLFDQREYHGLIHISFSPEIGWKILDDDLEFVICDVLVVEFLFKVRTIISRERDSITSEDLCAIKDYFINKNQS